MALTQTKNEFRDAERAVLFMRQAESFLDFESAWKTFLGSIQKVWVKLRLECGNNPKFSSWQKPVIKIREADPLLAYLQQARNADEHTIQDTMRHLPGSYSAHTLKHPSGVTHIHKLSFGAQGEITEYSGNVPLLVTVIFPRIVLLPFTNRGVGFEVPTSHLGQALADRTPVAVAELALTFYRNAVADAGAACGE